MRGEGALRANNKIQVAHGNLELGEASGGGLVRMGTREEVREPPRPTSPRTEGAVTLPSERSARRGAHCTAVWISKL